MPINKVNPFGGGQDLPSFKPKELSGVDALAGGQSSPGKPQDGGQLDPKFTFNTNLTGGGPGQQSSDMFNKQGMFNNSFII